MNFLFCSTLLAVLFTFAVESESSSSHSALSSNETLVVNNTTQVFVRKILKQYSSRNDSTQIAVNEFYGLLKALRIGEVYDVRATSEDVESQDKQTKERSKEVMISRTLIQDKYTTSHLQEKHRNCIRKEELLQLHHMDKDNGIHMDDFILLCPSLVYEVQSGACLHVDKLTKDEQTDMALEVWLYGLLAITVISLSSLFAIAIIPCLGKAIYNKVMSFLVSLAVGTLAGDAFLHLIPHAFLRGVKLEDQKGQVKPVWKGVVIMAGIYVFLMVEMLMKLRAKKHGEKQENEQQNQEDASNEDFDHSRPCKILVDDAHPVFNHDHCAHKHPRDMGLDSPSTANETEVLSDLSHSDGIGYGNTKTTEKWQMPLYSKVEQEEPKASFSENDLRVILNQRFECKASYDDMKQCSKKGEPSCSSDIDLKPSDKLNETEVHHPHPYPYPHHHHHHHHHHGKKEISVSTPIATVAWMVIVGDGFHNFSDGLAVGAAFSSSITNGLTTAIAVLCHELPHELGDFAVLIKSGIPFRQALIYNMVSAIISYLGLIIGLALGNLDTSHVWVLALTSGLFLYISLVGMLPELSNYQAKGEGCSIFLWQNAGILTGIVIMLVIALLEQH